MENIKFYNHYGGIGIVLHKFKPFTNCMIKVVKISKVKKGDHITANKQWEYEFELWTKKI